MKSGGHNWDLCYLRDGAVLLDLASWNKIDFISEINHGNVEGREKSEDIHNEMVRGDSDELLIVRVQPGVQSHQLISVLSSRGFTFPVGHCESVAVGGYLLAGGHGFDEGEKMMNGGSS